MTYANKKRCTYQRLYCHLTWNSKISKLATCQYFTRDEYVSLASFTGNSFFQMMWVANFQLANSHSQTYNSQIRRLATRRLANSQLAHENRKWLGSLLFYTINCWTERVKWVARTGRKHLTGDGLTYQNALHMHISTRLNFGYTMPGYVIFF